MPTAGSTTSRRIASGSRWAISSISIPPCGCATTTMRSRPRSRTSPRYSSRAIGSASSTSRRWTGRPSGPVWAVTSVFPSSSLAAWRTSTSPAQSRTPPALPRAPEWTWAFTTQRPLQLHRRRRKDLVRERDLRGVDRPLPLVAERRGPPGGSAKALRILEVTVRPVDRSEPVGAARRDHARQCRMPLIAGVVRVGAPDAHGSSAQARREIGHSEVHRLEAAAGLRDGLHVGHAQGRLDQDLHTDAVGEAARGLDLREQRVHEVDIGGDADLRQQHDVQPVSRLFHDVHHVAVHVVGVDAVDAHADRLATRAPVVLQQPGNDVLARLLLVRRRDGVLEVEEYDVRIARERLREQRRLRAGHRELTALQPGRGRLVARQAHARTAAREAKEPGLPPGGWGWGWASAEGAATARGGSGAALPR